MAASRIAEVAVGFKWWKTGEGSGCDYFGLRCSSSWINIWGSMLNARQNAMNSITSIRRSPRSHRPTNKRDTPIFRARSAWVSPASSLLPRSIFNIAAYSDT